MNPDAAQAIEDARATVADSMFVVPPVYGLPTEKLLFYSRGIAKTFYE